ncbi:MAG: hypothetical protein FJZ56_04285 [Chlamydiae bacterium]|nr:hypothetical protein [Chlamydiota bacterium]
MEQLRKNIWQESCSIWLGTEFILKRNIDKYPFSEKMSPEQKNTTHALLKEALLKLSLLKNPLYFSLNELGASHRELWQERFLSTLPHIENDQGIVIDDTGNFSALIHPEDHLHLYLMSSSNPSTTAWKDLLNIENELTSLIRFAFHPQFGYLTADPKMAGTALVARGFLHLPALIQGKHLETLIEMLPEDVIIYGLGEEKEFIGDLVVIENRFKIGINEETILQVLLETIKNVVEKEKSMREKMKQELPSEMVDKISRAHGLLCFCHQLKTEEALKNVSLAHLGGKLEWIKDVPEHFFSSLFFQLRRGYLLSSGENITKLDEARSRIIRSLYEKSSLAV